MRERSHNPQRTCIGCNRRDAKNALLRVALVEGALVLDRRQRLGGRGGYLHHMGACLDHFERRTLREFRSLRRKITLVERKRITELIRGATG